MTESVLEGAKTKKETLLAGSSALAAVLVQWLSYRLAGLPFVVALR